MLALSGGIERTLIVDETVSPNGAPPTARTVGSMMIAYFAPGVSASVGWKTRAFPAIETGPAIAFPAVTLLTTNAPVAEVGSSATSNVAVGRNASVALIVEPFAGVSETRCRGCDAKTSVPKGTISSASGFFGPA